MINKHIHKDNIFVIKEEKQSIA
uniref:BLTX696 n=1 Tax=Nephila pilipes TaxID=299642 RepID=A0A076L0A6_NEPPI|nr:BLTX696 [Nephila pilipes]